MKQSQETASTGTPTETVEAKSLTENAGDRYELPELKPVGSVEPGKWMRSIVIKDEITRYLNADGTDFINDSKIRTLIEDADRAKSENTEVDRKQIDDIVAKSKSIKSLTLEEAAVLMRIRDPETRAALAETALSIKKRVYDNRIVTFAPLYISNDCVNTCRYCGFRHDNGCMKRQRLSMDEIREEVKVMVGTLGHKRMVLDVGEHPDSDYDYLMHAMDTIYSVSVPTRTRAAANIRRINLNVAPMSIEHLGMLKEVGLGTFQVFQETYDRDLYAKLHPGNSPKSDYRWRLYCMHRAMDAGVDDVGLGALFGLTDWRFELLGLLSHTRELESRYNGVGAHTISFPRLRSAQNAPYLSETKSIMSDDDFLWLLTLLRLCVPYTGLICTAREPKEVREEALKRGITQMDASSKIGIGAYARSAKNQEEDRQQFMLGDGRSLEELIGDLADAGSITSFCTAGYRIGRRGGKIMRLLRDCSEGNFCKLNAIITFREWLDDFAGPEVKAKGEALIARELDEAKKKLPQFMNQFEPMYQKTIHGCRDLYL
jgi:2-iminoacetate synthase